VNWDEVGTAFSNGFFQKLLGIIGGTCGIAMILSFLFRYALTFYEGNIVCVSLIAFNVCQAGIVIVLISQIEWVIVQYPVIFTLICVAFFDLYAFGKRDQIPFAEEALKTSNRLMVKNNSLVLVAFLVTIFQIMTSILWFIGMVAIVAEVEGNNFMVLIVLISYYWTKNCYYNLLHFLVSSVTALWCYNPDGPSPIKSSCGRTFTSSFGTVCFGSLVASCVLIVEKFVRYTCCGDCNPCVTYFIRILDNIIKTYNRYALTCSAIFGWSYCESVSGIKRLMTSGSALEAISNEVITRIPLLAGGLICSLGASLVGAVLSVEYIMNDPKDTHFLMYVLWWIFYYLLISGIVDVALSVSHSALITVYLCWNQDPHLFNNSHPE